LFELFSRKMLRFASSLIIGLCILSVTMSVHSEVVSASDSSAKLVPALIVDGESKDLDLVAPRLVETLESVDQSTNANSEASSSSTESGSNPDIILIPDGPPAKITPPPSGYILQVLSPEQQILQTTIAPEYKPLPISADATEEQIIQANQDAETDLIRKVYVQDQINRLKLRLYNLQRQLQAQVQAAQKQLPQSQSTSQGGANDHKPDSAAPVIHQDAAHESDPSHGPSSANVPLTAGPVSASGLASRSASGSTSGSGSGSASGSTGSMSGAILSPTTTMVITPTSPTTIVQTPIIEEITIDAQDVERVYEDIKSSEAFLKKLLQPGQH